MQSFYRWHWNPVHAGIGYPGLFRDEQELFAKTPNDIIKIITVDETIPYLDRLPAGCRILVRNQPLSENWNNRGIADESAARGMASAHAASMLRTARWAEERGVSRDRLWFSGLNEQMFPEGGGHEPYALGAIYWQELLRLNHANHLHTVIGEFGVGWPPDKGGKDSPVNFEPFRPAYEAMDSQDAWSYHAYWGGFGVDHAFDWLAGRMGQRPAWMHGHRLWLTECGSDRAPGNSPTAGWLTYPESSVAQRADRYMAELAHFEQRIRESDPDVEYAFIFTMDGNRTDWGHFDIMNQDLLSRLIPYLQADHAFATPPAGKEDTGNMFADELRAEFGAQFSDLRASLAHGPTPYLSRPESSIDKIVVHHSAGAASVGWPAIAQYHVSSNGWPGIGYHIGVGPGGTVALLNDLTTESYHVGTLRTPVDDNLYAIGVCLLGNYDVDQPPADMVAALKRVVAVLDKHFAPRTLQLMGHRDIGGDPPETACPGRYLYPVIPSLRPATAVPSPAPVESMKESVQRAAGAVVPDGALYKYAVAHHLGLAQGPEFVIGGYTAQAYTGGLVYAKTGDWGNISFASW